MFFFPWRNCRALKMHHADSCPFRHTLHLCLSEQGEAALCREEAELPSAGRSAPQSVRQLVLVGEDTGDPPSSTSSKAKWGFL